MSYHPQHTGSSGTGSVPVEPARARRDPLGIGGKWRNPYHRWNTEQRTGSAPVEPTPLPQDPLGLGSTESRLPPWFKLVTQRYPGQKSLNRPATHHSCARWGDFIPNAYVDRVFLEETLVDANPDPNVLDVLQTLKITINLKLVDQLSANGTYTLLEEALIPNSNLNLKQYFQVFCVVAVSPDATDYFEQAVRDGTSLDDIWHAGSGRPDTLMPAFKTLDEFTCTYKNSDGNIELIAPYTIDFSSIPALSTISTTPLEYLTIFAYVQLDTDLLAGELNLEIPESIKNIIGSIEQELVIQNSQIVSLIKKVVLSGVTTVDAAHDHTYTDLDSDGNGWTAYATHPEEPRIKHRHEIIDGVVQMARSECWMLDTRQNASDPYPEGSCEALYGFSGVGPHSHQLQTIWEPIPNVQDFRIRDEISVLTAQFTSLRTELLAFPEQQDILAKAFAANSYLSELFVTKDADKNARFFFAFDYGKFCLESSKYAHIISKLPDAAKQEVIDNSQMTRFIVSRRQVREEPAVNSLGSPVKNYLLDNGHSTIDTPVILSLDDENINEINLILEDQPFSFPSPGSTVRFFTGIDTDINSQSDGVYQYSIDIEVIDGFVAYMNTVSSNLSQAMMEYQKYAALTQIPDVYDVESRKFTVYGQEVMAPNQTPADSMLIPIIETYLNTIGNFIDLTDTINGTPKYDYYGAKIFDLINPYWGGIEGVLLFNNLLTSISTQINNIIDAGYPGAGIEHTLTNHPSNNTSTFQLQTVELKEYFVNTIGARFINESYADNMSGFLPSAATNNGGGGLSLYTRLQLLSSGQEEVNLDIKSNLNRTDAELLGTLGITYNVFPITQGTFGAPDYTPASNYTTYSPSDLLLDTLGAIDLADEELPDLPDAVYASLLNQIRASGRESSPALNANVDVLTGFVFQDTRTSNTVSHPMMRIARFETKPLASLKGFYLCRQTRRSDVEVINSYFLLTI